MKKGKYILVFWGCLLVQTAFAQRFDLQVYKPDHAIQEEVNEWYNRDIWGGYEIGNLWSDKRLTQPNLSLIREVDRYLLRVDLFSSKGVYVTDITQHPIAKFEDAEGRIVSLRCDSKTPVVVTQTTGSFGPPIVGSTWNSGSSGSTTGNPLPERRPTYMTILSYVIPDLNGFSHHQFVKVSMCDGAIEYDLREGGSKTVKKFNKRLQKAVKHVAKLQKPSKIRIDPGWMEGFNTSAPGMRGYGF